MQVFFHLFIFKGDEVFSTQCYTFSKLSVKDAHHLSTEMAQQSINEARLYHNLFSKPKMGENTDFGELLSVSPS